jgi:hypothetical protein
MCDVSVGSLLGMGTVTGQTKWRSLLPVLASRVITLRSPQSSPRFPISFSKSFTYETFAEPAPDSKMNFFGSVNEHIHAA